MPTLAAISFLIGLAVVFTVALLLPRILRWRERRQLDSELARLLEEERNRRDSEAD